LMRAATTGRGLGTGQSAVHVVVLLALASVGFLLARRTFARRLTP